MKMNRIGQVVEPGKVVFLSQEEKPLQPDEVRIKIAASAICGSDLHIFKGKHPSAPLPVTVGHEFSGDIVEVGKDVKSVRQGERVTVEPVIVCGHCDACRRGEYSYCENISFTYRIGMGAMADTIVIKEPYLYSLPEALSYEAGALIEPLAVAVHAVRRAQVTLGDRVAVIGAGAIGILVAAVSKACGASQVIVSDLNQARLELALEFGATDVVDSSKADFLLETDRLTDGKGVDKSFECVGHGATLHQAMFCLRKNGVATVVGIFEQPDVQVVASRFITHEIRVQGSQSYCRDFPAALDLAQRIDLERLVTHRFALTDLEQALSTCLDPTQNAVKVLIRP